MGPTSPPDPLLSFDSRQRVAASGLIAAFRVSLPNNDRDGSGDDQGRREWPSRFLAAGAGGWADASPRPNESSQAIEPAKALGIAELRMKRLTQACTAAAVGVSKNAVGRVLARAALSRLADLQPAERVVRIEREASSHAADRYQEARARRFTTRPTAKITSFGWKACCCGPRPVLRPVHHSGRPGWPAKAPA